MVSDVNTVNQGGQSASCLSQVSDADVSKRNVYEPPIASPSDCGAIKHRSQSNDPDVQQVPYADIGKNCSDVNVSGSSQHENVNTAYQSGEQSVCASRSQASLKYGRSRNKQCTCNSLTFLAFLYENENITRADLDRVLDKGNVVYKQVRKTVRNHIHLTTDELPKWVPARSHMQRVDMLQLSRYGTFGDPDPGAVDTFLELEMGLSCLLSDVQYALLLMASLCIAVFRTRSGRYGFFDPHARTPHGLPRLQPRSTPGTAVMVTFTRLSDMIHRLISYHHILSTPESCKYELKPVVFYDVNPNDDIPATEGMCTSSSVITTQIQDTQSNFTQALINNPVTSDNVLNDISSTLSKLNKAQKKKILRRVMTPQKTPQKKDNQKRKEREKYAKDETYKAKKKCYSMSRYSVNPEIQTKKRQNIRSKYRESTDFRLKQKLYMTRKYRENVDFKNRQKQYMNKKYRENVDFKDRQKQYLNKKYRENVDFKDRQKQYLNKKYRENVDFKDRQKQYLNKKYRENVHFKDRKKQYITKKYKDNVDFKARQKQYITKKYKDNVDFKARQKQYITTKYKENVAFKATQKQYITTKYSENVAFKTRQKEYIRKKYSEDVNFRQRQRSFMHHRYANDIFRHQHRQLMRRMMRDRYKKNLAYRTMHKTRCALKISQKYKAISKRTRQTDRESENPLIESAISDFRSHIKAGPTHVCTVCHKASFPNQVQKCKRSNYVKNPIMVSACLKGQYVHECNDNCRNQCTVPDERKTEWICHTCHNHVKNGSMPKLAIANNLELADIPPELCDLNILERHLIAKCITFAKIIPLPKGRQRAIHGNVVCVPSEVQETIHALPRLRNESQVMRVKLKRRLSYRGHHLFQTVTWSKLVQALHKLKEIHPQYEDITIRDEEELCDPTLPDDGYEDEDEDD
ncbi:uncharacterized protein LOC117832690 isoform X1, partial [Xyrichtys novacula]